VEYFSNVYGLTGETDPTSENGQLFLVEYLFLINDLYPDDPDLEQVSLSNVMKEQLYASKVESGLYHRNPVLVNKTMSHDNLLAITSFSKVYGTFHAEEIWSYLVRHFGVYDNTKGRSKEFEKILPFNPGNYFIFGLCADSLLAYLFLPIFTINLIISCNQSKEKVSGKLLDYVSFFPHRNRNFILKALYAYYVKKMTAMYGQDYMKEIITIYHGKNSKEFPLCKLFGVGLPQGI
jgi:hypothetical protein